MLKIYVLNYFNNKTLLKKYNFINPMIYNYKYNIKI